MNKNSTSVIFTGDIVFDRYMNGAWAQENLLSQSVLNFFSSSNHVCANVEGAIIDIPDDGSRGIFFHAMSHDVTAFLKKIGADIWAVGNNHIMDAGIDGVISTKRLAIQNNAVIFGAGLNIDEASMPVFIDEAGGIGIFGVSYMTECIPATKNKPGVFRWDDMDLIAQHIYEIKSKCRWCIVVAHGGEEFAPMPAPYTRERYIKYLHIGADAVVGNHPHVTENYELFDNGKAIFYSLGNFILDTDYQRTHLYTDTGILLKLIFTEKTLDFDAIGIKLNRNNRTINICPLPDIFTNIPEWEYTLLSPLAAKAFLEEDKRKMIFINPSHFENADDDVWKEYFYDSEIEGYSKGAHMDLAYLLSIAEKYKYGDYKKSTLEKVKEHLFSLI